MFVFTSLLMGGGIVQGQVQLGTGGIITAHDSCIFQTDTFYGNTYVEYIFVSDANSFELTVQGREYVKFPVVFENMLVYNSNDSLLDQFYINQVSWSQSFTVPTIGDTFLIRLETNNPPPWYEFDICLRRIEPVGYADFDFFNPDQCTTGDEYFTNLSECYSCPGFYSIWYIDGVEVLATPTLSSPNLSSYPNGTYQVELCVYCCATSYPSPPQNFSSVCTTQTIIIYNEEAPTIDIVESNQTICPGELCFHDITTWSDQVLWDVYFDNGGGYTNITGNSVTSNFEFCHDFQDIGNYMIIASAMNDCGMDAETLYVEVVPPSANFTWEGICVGNDICFTELAECEEFWHWDFGDGNTSTQENPCHSYSQAGIYPVTLTIDQTGTSITYPIQIIDAIQPIITGDEYACDPLSHYEVSPTGAFTQIGWAVNNPSGWVSTTPPDEFDIAWPGNTGGMVYVQTTDINGCVAEGEFMVFDCCTNGNIVFYNDTAIVNVLHEFKVISVIGDNTLSTGSFVDLRGCLVEFSPNSKITIESGATLKLGKECILQACNGIMWDGIYIENGGTLISEGQTRIMDAKNAVVSLDGGFYDISFTYFDKNFKHLVVEPFAGNHSGTIEKSSLSCTSSILPQYPPVVAYRTQDAITVNKVSTINIGSRFKGNTIENCDVGILAANSFVRVVGNTFQNIEPGLVMFGQPQHPRGYGILTSSLDMFGVNNHGLSTMPATLSFQGGNTFTNVTNGIFSFMNGNVNIRKNNFNYSNNPQGRGTAITLAEWVHPTNTKSITQNTISNYNTGILVGNAENVRIDGNDVRDIKMPYYSLPNARSMGIRVEGGNNTVVQSNEVRNTGTPDWRWEGISVSNTGSMIVSCNTVRNMGKSIRFQGVNDPVEIKKNRMFSGAAGIVLSDNGFINEQGTSGTPWDNEWYNFNGMHLYTMNYTDASGINYHIWSGNGPKHPNPFGNDGQYGSFPFNLSLENGSLFMLCATPLLSATQSYSAWMDDVANNTNINLQSPMHRNWMGRNGLYKAAKTDSSIIQNSAIQNFVQQLDLESQGIIKTISDTILANDLMAAKQLNLTMPAYTKPDSLSKVINAVFINASLSGANDWTEAMSIAAWDSLRYFASLCPFEYGENVYISRIVLKLVGDTTDYFNECEYENVEAPGKSMTNAVNTFTANIYPNPASTQLTVETDIALPASITLYSSLGQVLLVQELNEDINTVNISSISAQLVLYEIKGASGETVRGLLQITH
ncbi:MAG: T9SS type A sorting domain-containing protein [Bacteroidales bacterium]|nr:T9SS type A sorting domain-containing protein [Bacteroidales bacterium]